MYIKSHPRRLPSFCTVRPAFASQRLDLRTFRRSDAKCASRMGLRDVLLPPSPAPASDPQLLLLSILKAPINRAESTLLQVFFLKNLKPIGINTFEKQGEGSPLWLTNCYKRVSIEKVRRNLSLPSSVHSSKLCRLQLLCLPERSRSVERSLILCPRFRLCHSPPQWKDAEDFKASPARRDRCEKSQRHVL